MNYIFSKSFAIVLTLVLISMLIAGCASQDSNTPTKTDASGTVSATGTDILANNKTGHEQTQATIAQAIADGTYAGNVSYFRGGNDTVEFSLSVKNDVVTDVAVKTIMADEISANYISNFASALPDLVVGKKITELNLPYQVSGASATTEAFQNYVDGLIQKK